MNLALDKLPQVAENLESHAEAARIKKMLYCLAKDTWENEPTILGRYSLEQLLIDIVQSTPDINRLLSSLIRVVKNLNRQEIYAPLVQDIVMELLPVYNMDVRKINQVELQKLINKAQGSQDKRNFVCFNLMEFLVKEEAYKEMQKLPVNMAKFIAFGEVCTYALNRLPALYVSSEEGKQYQLKKAEEIKDKIHATVLQAIAAIRRDPLRKATPLDLPDIDSHSVFAGFVLELEQLLQLRDDNTTKVPVKELSDKALETIRVYKDSLREIEEFLQAKNLINSKITVINLVPTLRKVINQILRKENVASASLSPAVLKEIEDFLWAEKLNYSKLTPENLVSTIKTIIHQLQVEAAHSQQTASASDVLASSPLKQKILDLLHTYESLIANSSSVNSQPLHDPATIDILDAHEQMIASLNFAHDDRDNLETSLSSQYVNRNDPDSAIINILDVPEPAIAEWNESENGDNADDSSQTQFIAFSDLEHRKQQERNLHQTMMINFDQTENEDDGDSQKDWYAL
ncbi:MAG: late competence development ComFB family protein [Snowella sp.]|nr:late competence development ComFB family protein [Snowella sp.]